MDVKESPGSDSRNSTPEPRAIFKDKKEALEAFKELLREKVIKSYWNVKNMKRIWLLTWTGFLIIWSVFHIFIHKERAEFCQLGSGPESDPARSPFRGIG